MAKLVFAKNWHRVSLIMMATNVVDLDRLPANPLHDPGHCSIGFLPLHAWLAIIICGIASIFPQTRLADLGLLVPVALDRSDYLWLGAL